MSARATVITAAIFLFAIVSAPRLQLDYAPALALPELSVALHVAGASDPQDTTTRWVVPIESAIRSLGDVTGTNADITGSDAFLTVRFRRGTDVEVKAARLQSELASVRAKLPQGSSLQTWPATPGRNRPSALIALTGNADARRIADALRAARGVRDVRTYGLVEREVEIAMTTDHVPASAARAATEAVAPRALGTRQVGPREVAVVATPGAIDLREVPLRAGASVIRLGAVADIRHRTAEATSLARVNGKPATIVALFRDDDVSLFTFDASVRERLRGVAHEEISSDAAELRAMLRRVAIGLLAASLLLALATRSLALGIYPLLAVAIAMNVFRLTSTNVNAQTVVVTIIAIAAVTPFAVWRELRPLFIGAVFVLLVPLAATFGSGALAPILAPPSRAFVLAALSSLAASTALSPRERADAKRRVRGRFHRIFLRESFAVVLTATTLTCLLLTYFGNSLDPRAVGTRDSSTIGVQVQLPAGATLAQTSALVERIEAGLRNVSGITRTTAFVQTGRAEVTVELEPRLSDPIRRRVFNIELYSYVPLVPGMISIDERNRGRAVRFVDDFEHEPSSDVETGLYRVLLKGTDADALRRTYELIATRLSRLDVRRSAIHAEWPAPAQRAALVPRRDTSVEEAERMAMRLGELTMPATAYRLPDGRTARVLARGAPRSQDVVPQRADLIVREPSLGAKFDLRNELVPGGATRELGRFVMPIRIVVPRVGDRVIKRAEIDRTLATMALPAGITLERPLLSEWTFSIRKLRLVGLAAFFPLLLFAASAIVLASLRGALAAVATSAVGLAAAAPALKFSRSSVDELTLLAMAAALCCTTAVAVVALLRTREETSPAYRAQRRFAAPTLAALIAVIALLAVPASAPAAATDGWRAPVLASLTVLVAGVPAALLVAPAIGFVARDIRRRRTPVARAASHPAEWRVAPPPSAALALDAAATLRTATPHLTVRNVTKHYAGGFRALHRVSFELAPGIIGLLGPNGAGKTTLLRVMTGLLLPTRGQVLYRGVAVGPHNLAEYRRLIGFLPQEFNAYAGLTAADFLDFWALERGMSDLRERRATVERLLETVGLTQDANRRVRDFSGGMRQRIGIARALLGDPPLLVVDEPTTGLDLESRNRFRDLLATLAADRIIILSTHIAGDVEATASRILLLAKGTLRWDGAPEELIGRARGRVFDAVVAETDARAMTHQFRITTRQRVAGGIHVRGVVPAGAALPGAAVEPTLEEAYLAEVAGDRAMRASGFAFLFEKGLK